MIFPLSLIQKGNSQYRLLVLVNHLGGVSLPKNGVVRKTDHPMTTAIPHGRPDLCGYRRGGGGGEGWEGEEEVFIPLE